MIEYAKPSKIEKEKVENSYKDWYVELKYDGARQFLLQESGNTKLLNKRGKNKTRHFPEVTKKICNLPDNTVLDGEIVTTDELHPHGNKNVLQKRDGGKPVLRKKGKKNFKQKMKLNQYPAKFVAFDILRYRDRNMRDVEIEERREKLRETVDQLADCVMISQRFDTFSEGWSRVEEDKMEGLILKKPETSYPEGRTSKWRKVKNIQDTILTCSDYEEHSRGVTVIGEDEHSDNHRFTVNGVVSDKVKEKLEKGEAEIEVSYLERSKNGKLREPRFKQLKN
jgi:ATP-dependent DNA ligase